MLDPNSKAHRFDLAAALAKNLIPVPYGDWKARNVSRVRLLRADALQGSIREAIDRALSEHKEEMRRLRSLEARHREELDAQRRGFEAKVEDLSRGDGARATEQCRKLEAALPAATERATRAESAVAALEAELERVRAELDRVRLELERTRRELQDVRGRCAEALIEREKIREELTAAPTRQLEPPGSQRAPVAQAAPHASVDEPVAEDRRIGAPGHTEDAEGGPASSVPPVVSAPAQPGEIPAWSDLLDDFVLEAIADGQGDGPLVVVDDPPAPTEPEPEPAAAPQPAAVDPASEGATEALAETNVAEGPASVAPSAPGPEVKAETSPPRSVEAYSGCERPRGDTAPAPPAIARAKAPRVAFFGFGGAQGAGVDLRASTWRKADRRG